MRFLQIPQLPAPVLILRGPATQNLSNPQNL